MSELVTQPDRLEQELADHFDQHPDAKIIRSLPGLGTILGARALPTTRPYAPSPTASSASCGCLRHHTLCNEHTAWGHPTEHAA